MLPIRGAALGRSLHTAGAAAKKMVGTRKESSSPWTNVGEADFAA
jgi:hypothetical protein